MRSTRTLLLGAAAALGLSGFGFQAPDLGAVKLPSKRAKRRKPALLSGKIRRSMRSAWAPHQGAKESAKRYAEFKNPHTGHVTVGRIY